MKNHNQYNGGIADVWYSGVRDLWVEYKFIVVPKRPDTVIDLLTGKAPAISYLQQEWLRSRHGEGRSVGVVVGSKDGGVWFPGLAWDQPLTAADFLKKLQSRKELADVILKETHG
ncbi:hypothetical protein DBR23_23415 [Acidovorax sp. HMWF018]|uniref:hypothetical protein n=1 Tax=Acidovorax sp. HMWF018 TaxID=2056855 RepID=UPI000D4C6CA3|nr:hypothetical protein [Acidovorax sp. HMWF018]PTT35457.1 hypothetical protein DBR23_23415 [Acidovorax sp. HMWF018]